MNFIINESIQKLRGGYYTPKALADFIVSWTVTESTKKVLEPSCGDGAFISSLAKSPYRESFQFLGIEIDADEAKKSENILQESGVSGRIHHSDFLEWYINRPVNRETIDAVIGNPPFIRYQYLPEIMQVRAEHIFKSLGLKFTKHTNAWIPFILAGIEILRPGGRLGMVIPTEVFNVIYAQSLRTYLGETCSKITIIDPEDIWFVDTLQGAVILLAEKKQVSTLATDGLGIIRTSGLDFCRKNPADMLKGLSRINGRSLSEKWTSAFLDEKEYAVYERVRNHPNVKTFEKIASADVGIVTGANDFFLVDAATVEEFDLAEFAHPMFGRSDHCPGVIYDSTVHASNVRRGIPSSFIWIKPETRITKKKHKEYIAWGESRGLHLRYKCGIRSPWYSVPSVYATEIGMLKRSHDLPRLIYNDIGAYTTDTAYRVKVFAIDAKSFVFGFVNSLTALSAEIEGRSYGGGVLELVPSEINRLLIPVIKFDNPSLDRLNELAISKDPLTYLPEQDKAILGKIGVSQADQEILHGAWLKLRNRRHRIAM